MPAYFALGFVAMVGLVYCLRWAAQVDAAALARFLKYLAIAVGIAGIVLLFAVGRFGLVFVAAALLFPLWRRWRSRRAAADIGSQRGGTSSIETAYLSVSLDHDSGTVDGRIKAGSFKDRRLADLSLADMLHLLTEIRAADPEGVSVLEAYLDRVHGSDWRNAEADSGSGRASRGSGTMTREEALEILGLSAGAGEAEIREAHHRLMLKVHPDHGGSTYLAARLNQARDRLLAG